MLDPEAAPHKPRALNESSKCCKKADEDAAIAKFLVLPTCRDVRKYLVCQQLATHPELWFRHQDQHTLTRDKRSWSYASLDDEVRGKSLEYINIEKISGEYIVVLRHQDQQDVPQPTGW